MTANNRFFDDVSKLMTNAMGVAQGAKDEAQTAASEVKDQAQHARENISES